MEIEPLQQVPLFNLILHWSVLLLGATAFVVSAVIWVRSKRQNLAEAAGYWKLITFGLFFFTLSEYSDLFTPGLKASLGVHNYLTEQLLFVGVIFFFIAIRRLITKTAQPTS